MPRVTVPPGCTGLSTADGTRYNADRNGLVRIDERHTRAVRQQYGSIGLIDAGEPMSLGTKTTRWCYSCRPARAWQAWTRQCPRCGAETIEENPS